MDRRQALALLLCLSAALSCASPPSTEESTLTLFAAASLRDVVTELAQEFKNSEQGSVQGLEPVEIVFNFAGSNTLAQQIEAAPGADVFLSADMSWIEHLEDAGRITPGGSREVFSNRLAIIARTDSPHRLDDALHLTEIDFRHLALASPDAVPVGRYARTALQNLNLWSAVVDRVVPTLDARANLALVESDPEILGVVYRTDALTSSKVHVLTELDAPAVKIAYGAAVVAGSKNEAMASRLLNFLETAGAREIVARHGFLPLD